MKPVDQLKEHIPGVSKGDCLRACIASILELDPATLPHFAEDWPDSLMSWLKASKYVLVHHYSAPKGMSIANGESPRGLLHSVLHFNGKLLHDPHQSRAGLKTVQWWYTLEKKGD